MTEQKASKYYAAEEEQQMKKVSNFCASRVSMKAKLQDATAKGDFKEEVP
jgi:hypothetical protein